MMCTANSVRNSCIRDSRNRLNWPSDRNACEVEVSQYDIRTCMP